MWHLFQNYMQSLLWFEQKEMFEYISKGWKLGLKLSFRPYEDISIKVATRTKSVVEEGNSKGYLKVLSETPWRCGLEMWVLVPRTACVSAVKMDFLG